MDQADREIETPHDPNGASKSIGQFDDKVDIGR